MSVNDRKVSKTIHKVRTVLLAQVDAESSIHEAAMDAVTIADVARCPVHLSFNDRWVLVEPDSKASEVVKAYRELVKKSALIH